MRQDFLASLRGSGFWPGSNNPLKEAPGFLSDPIPQTPWGHYGKVSGNAWSMLLVWFIRKNSSCPDGGAQVAKPGPGMKV